MSAVVVVIGQEQEWDEMAKEMLAVQDLLVDVQDEIMKEMVAV